MKILIADDDQVSLMMMRRMLLQSGYDVVTANNGIAAVESILEKDGPRLLLLDWMMPELSGPEVCQAIRTRAEKGYVYIILITAKDTKDDLIAGLEAGADDFLTKPCHPEELRARLRTGQRVLRLEDGLLKAHEEMHFRANHDALTSLLNRGAIGHRLSADLQQIPGSDDVSVVLCDVDHFKAINDTYGHPVGDEVLREVARRLQAACGARDAVGRFGGEEFLFVLKNVEANTLSLRANDIRKAIRDSCIQTSAGPIRVSISAGAVCVGIEENASSPDRVLKSADLLLYQAKKEGRDRVVTNAKVHPSILSQYGAATPQQAAIF